MIEAPIHFEDAIRFLLEKEPNPAEWDSSEWAMERPSVRVKSFFSAKVENARFLDRAQGFLFDFMAGTTEKVVSPEGVESIALRAGGRAGFVRSMRAFMVKEGMARPEEFAAVNQGDVKDIRSLARLNLIFDTNVRQAYGYGNWRQGMMPAVRYRFPASRFIRTRGVMIPRIRHAAHEGDVRLKTDRAWWADYQNDPLIGGFGVPWPPYGFHSGMDQQDVSREEAKRLGLKVDRLPVVISEELPSLADTNTASVKKMDPAIKKKLLAEIDAKIEQAKAGKKSPEDYAAERIAKMQVREDGDRIVLESPAKSGSFSSISNGNDPQPTSGNIPIPIPQIGNLARQDEPAADVAARIDRAIKRNPQQGRETVAEKIRRERDALGWLAAQDPGISIPFHAVSDIAETNEHNIRIADDGRFWKYTKGDQYGYAPAETYPDVHDFSNLALGIDPASPSQYLDRIRLHNRLFGDVVKIEGISSTGGLVVSQRYIKGREATEEEIDSGLASAGWVKVPSGRQALSNILKDTAWYHRETKAIMVDARPANILVDGEGRLQVIDVMLRTAEDALLALLEKL